MLGRQGLSDQVDQALKSCDRDAGEAGELVDPHNHHMNKVARSSLVEHHEDAHPLER